MMNDNKVTMRTVRHWAQDGNKFAMLTCYDATTARWLARAGVKTMLVGDSAGSVILGHESTIFTPLDFLLTITAAVRRGAPDCFLVGDMPFLSYQANETEAIHNAGRFMTEGMVDIVKLEVDESYVELVGKISRASIPVMAHIGWRPQRTQQVGVPVVAGRTKQAVEKLVDMAIMMQDSGAKMILIEQSTAEVAERVVERVSIPVIGCGAGPACHGHVVVLHDLIGLSDKSNRPSFVMPTGDIGPQIQQAVAEWIEIVESGRYLKTDHPYKMNG